MASAQAVYVDGWVPGVRVSTGRWNFAAETKAAGSSRNPIGNDVMIRLASNDRLLRLRDVDGIGLNLGVRVRVGLPRRNAATERSTRSILLTADDGMSASVLFSAASTPNGRMLKIQKCRNYYSAGRVCNRYSSIDARLSFGFVRVQPMGRRRQARIRKFRDK